MWLELVISLSGKTDNRQTLVIRVEIPPGFVVVGRVRRYE